MAQREMLRKFLTKQIEKQWPDKLSTEEKNRLLTPGAPPQVSFASLSLSHSFFMGGFVISPDVQTPLGFDVEQAGRAKKRTVLRIADEEELRMSPSPSTLWSAKEAVYKSVHPLEDSIFIKQIRVFGWTLFTEEKNQNDQLKVYDYRFTAKNIKGKGFVCFSEEVVIAVSYYAE